jgi:hypothetical protein
MRFSRPPIQPDAKPRARKPASISADRALEGGRWSAGAGGRAPDGRVAGGSVG